MNWNYFAFIKSDTDGPTTTLRLCQLLQVAVQHVDLSAFLCEDDAELLEAAIAVAEYCDVVAD